MRHHKVFALSVFSFAFFGVFLSLSIPAAAGSISGRVIDSVGKGIQWVWIDVYVGGYYYLGIQSDENGYYTVDSLPAGNHKVQFWGSDEGYVNEWYDDKATFAAADPVSVAVAEDTPNIDAVLVQGGGSISGRVTAPGGGGIPDVWVDVYDANEYYASYSSTDQDGYYTVDGLRTGNYRVEFWESGNIFVEEWYDNKTSFATADLVAVTDPTDTGNINAELDPLAVADAICVYRGGAWFFYDFATGAEDYAVWTGGSTGCIPAPIDHDGDGEWEFSQLCDGSWLFYNDDGSFLKGIWTGGADDLPVPADYDGDGTEDVVAFRNGAWLFYDFDTGNLSSGVWTGAPAHWTGGTPVPVPMDYDGDGAADLTVYSGGPWHFFHADGTYNKGVWTGGVAGDVPVASDYDGDGTDDIVVFRGGAWLASSFTTGLPTWAVWTGLPPHWTGGTSLPAPLDYDGDGAVDLTVYSGGPWHFFHFDGSYNKGIWTGGVPGDMPISRRLLP